MKQLTVATARELKQRLYEDQGGKCPITGNALSLHVGDAHLDHDHALEGPNAGKVRGLLSRGANTFEGYVKKYFQRTGLQSEGVELSLVLRNLADYLEQDYSGNDFHPKYVPDMISKFKRLNLTDMRSLMTEKGYAFNDNDTRARLVVKYGKEFRKEQKAL
ncbi:MAG: endonuclease domain-containing protein [Bacilli bacterium]